ncbi:MAG: bile acid:sodium symporter family protein [Steroidobacterales bacterium]
MRRYLPDPFILALLATVAVATVWPCRGAAVQGFKLLTVLAIGLMFFLYGVRLSGATLLAGLAHWRLHMAILLCTFALYPLLGLAMARAAPGLLPPSAWLGLLFVCMLPSTVQSSIAFTSIAGGNVAGAICAATISNLLGTVLTPFLVAALVRTRGQVPAAEIWQILTQLLLPFLAGQLCRPWLGAWAVRHRGPLAISDRGSILLIVYTAFSAAVVEGIWQRLSWQTLLVLLAVATVLLGLVLAATTYGSRWLRFSHEDEIAIVFCGSKKSLASGIPIANVLFAGPALGMTVLPLMMFHQLQLMVASALAARYARRASAVAAATARVDDSPARGSD